MIFKIYSNRPKAVTKYRVYFDVESGRIISITNKEVSVHKDYFEVPLQDIEQFLNGDKNIVHYKVIFDIKQQAYTIVSKKENLIVYADDLVFNISQTPDYQILVEQDVKNKKWKISAESKLREKMKSVTSRLEEIMFFSITEKNNPNILYNHYYVSIEDIIKNDYVEFDFTSQDEAVKDLVSVYTNRKFDRYSHEVINE